MSALTNAILEQYPHITGRAVNPLDIAPALTHVLIRGRACDTSDVMLRENERASKIVRLTRIEDVSTVVARWLGQGRKIDSITPYA